MTLAAVPSSSAAAARWLPDAKPRLFVLTDISNEPDDEESMIRLLSCANEFDLEGLVATTSTWLRNTTRVDLIHRQLNAYGQVHDNLLKHAPGFPTAEALRAVTAAGQAQYGLAAVGEEYLKTLVVQEAVYRSAEERRPVEVVRHPEN